MEILNLTQGTQEWLDDRLKKFTASEAPFMMGGDKMFSRDALLDQKKGWTSIIDDYVLKLFQDGHDAEDKARPLAEELLEEDLAPLCGQLEETLYMASFDGITMFGDILFEHKLWNKKLAENVINNVLEPHYYWQLEHQLMVSGAKKVLFMVSNGTKEQMVYMFYEPISGRREQLIAGWQQFAKDLETHELKAKTVPVVAANHVNLPSITVSVSGSAITTNIGDSLETYKELAQKEMSKPLETQQDLKDKEELAKGIKKARTDLKDRVESVRNEFVSYSQFQNLANEMDGVLQKFQSYTEKQVKEYKETQKQAAINEATKTLNTLLMEASAKYNVNFPITVDFAGSLKGKRNIENMEGALNDALAAAKTELTGLVERVKANMTMLHENSEYEFLFNDWSSIALKPFDDFQNLMHTRIDAHKEAEAKRLEAERERIRQEEEAKAKREAEAKLKAEQEARAKAEAQAKAEQEAKEREAIQVQQPQDQAATLRTQSRLQQAQAIVDEVQSAPVTELKPKPSETITISREEYQYLLHRNAQLEALEAAGVDNWTGYGEAMEMLKAS